jgi:hypothetical protein
VPGLSETDPETSARAAAMDQLQRGLGLTDDEMDLARSLTSGHWAELGKQLTEELSADIPRSAALAAAMVTARGHAEGWLPADLSVSYALAPVPLWRGAEEPPPHVTRVRDANGHEATRGGWCDYCGPSGTRWAWAHNGRSECWLELDGIPPWVEVRGH